MRVKRQVVRRCLRPLSQRHESMYVRKRAEPDPPGQLKLAWQQRNVTRRRVQVKTRSPCFFGNQHVCTVVELRMYRRATEKTSIMMNFKLGTGLLRIPAFNNLAPVVSLIQRISRLSLKEKVRAINLCTRKSALPRERHNIYSARSAFRGSSAG